MLATSRPKAESTPGTDAAPATANHNIRFRDVLVTPVYEIDDENSKYANSGHAEDVSITGNSLVNITCFNRVTYGGAVATIPNWMTAANACGASRRKCSGLSPEG